jgi:cytoplasmic iron level regulating protein YaaA (DUF328/UPF0246 family)
MLFVLSPAKTSDYGIPKADLPHCRPDYGVLRRLDWMQPYRLEKAAALPVGPARILHPLCGTRISTFLNRRLAADHTSVVVNLASQEYAKTIHRQALKARPLDCVFEEWIGGGYRSTSFQAKKARGQMAPYAIEKRVVTPRQLQAFVRGGCSFDPRASRVDRMVLRRRIDQ